jgi:AMMECR1 domain-containing protein
VTLIARLLPLLLAVLAATGSPELEPYRAMSRDPAACESLLAAARAGLSRGLEPGAPAPAATGPAWPGSPRPVYVTLARGRATRACVGSDAPLGGSLAATLEALGERVVASDRRHAPLDAGELDTLRLVIAFAGDEQSVADPLTVDPVHEGLKIETDLGAIAFLPGEARTAAWALREARRAGVLAGPVSEARCSRFAAVVIQGPAVRAALHPAGGRAHHSKESP